jgi:hypothetical protein
MGIKPRLTPVSAKNCHPADTLLVLGNLMEGARAGDDFSIEKSVDGFH